MELKVSVTPWVALNDSTTLPRALKTMLTHTHGWAHTHPPPPCAQGTLQDVNNISRQEEREEGNQGKGSKKIDWEKEKVEE